MRNKNFLEKFYQNPGIYMKNKKSQIGETLTWFVAFLIIFFIMIIFLSAAVIISGMRQAGGKNEIGIEKYAGNLNSQRILISLLNSNIVFNEKEMKIKDALLDADYFNFEEPKKDELKSKIKGAVERLVVLKGNECYIFQALYGIEAPEKVSESVSGLRGSGAVSDFISKSTLEFSSSENTDTRVSGYVDSQKKKWLENSAEVILMRDTTRNIMGVDVGENQIIKIKFYIGKCI